MRDIVNPELDAEIQDLHDRWVYDLASGREGVDHLEDFFFNLSPDASSAIDGWGYSKADRIFHLRWKGSATIYDYYDVSADDVVMFFSLVVLNGSWGKAAHYIKKNYEAHRLEVLAENASVIVSTLTKVQAIAVVEAIQELWPEIG